MKNVANYIGILLLIVLSWLPMWLAYRVSDLLYYLIYYGIGYRKRVVTKNLTSAFPQKSKTEITRIRRKFYRHLCDLAMEGVKLRTLSSGELKGRMKVTNPELVNRYAEQGKSVLVLTMHYNNWEWNAILQQELKHKVLFVFNPARNLTFDRYFNRNRSRFGGELVSTKKILNRLIDPQQKEQPTFTWLCADQRPKRNARFRTLFLNREAGFFPGPESLARHTNQPVLYQHTRKVSRGHYETTFSILTNAPRELPPDGLLKRYVAQLEEDIRRQPEFYLWSHNRWKHTHSAQNSQQ